MEKYSAWRDASTGVLPFVLPVSPDSGSPSIIALAVLPLQILVVAIRIVLLGFFLALYSLFELIFDVTFPWFRQAIAFICLRGALLFCFGYYWIDEESVSMTRRTASSHLPMSKVYRPGELVLANLSSAVDVIYIACKTQPIFAKPYASPKDRSIGFRRASLISMLATLGSVPPLQGGPEGEKLETLVATAMRPVVVFPEGTSSNNRGLLRCMRMPALASTRTSAHILALRHDPPSSWIKTAVHPVPDSAANPLLGLVRAMWTLPFIPRQLTARWLLPAENPKPSAADFWTKSQAAMCQIGKLKQLSLGWEEKQSFLEYHRKGRSTSRR